MADKKWDRLSKYKSYSEEELLKNSYSKMPNREVMEEEEEYRMPKIKPDYLDEIPEAETMPEGFKKPIGIKGGGFIAKGCGKVMGDRRKVTKMY
jgi:hypothetical protein